MIDRNQHLVATLCISAAFFSSGLYAQTAKPKKEVSTEEALINAAVKPAPDRKAGEGMGPYDRLIIRGITVIDGTGAAPQGPMEVVVEHNKIVDVVSVGAPHVPIDPKRRPAKAEHEIDGTGMYLMPGFIDNHVHYGDPMKAPEAEYCNKLWLANGITTVRGVPAGPLDWALHERERSAKNETVAPRIFVYQFQLTGDGWKPNPVLTPELGREWVRFLASKKADGIKILGGDPNVIAAILDEGKKYKMGCHWSPVVSVSSRMSCFNYKSPLRAYVTGNTRSTFKPALFAFAL